VTSRPNIVTVPALARSRSARIDSSVLLPPPEGPAIAVTLPRGKSASTPRSACTSPPADR
jgi:hypothetical protein